MRFCCAILLAMFAVAPALSADWWFGGTTPDAHIFFDAEGLPETGAKETTGWVATINLENEEDGTAVLLSRWRVDCHEESYQIVQWTAYGDDQRVIESTPHTRMAAEAATPGSIGETAIDFFCRYSLSALEEDGFQNAANDPFELLAIARRVSPD